MWKFDFRHVTKALTACMAFLCGMLILQGCGKDAPDPYAALDKAYPNGRPEISSPEERAQDPAYSARIAEMGKKSADLAKALETARGTFEGYVAQYRKDLARRMGSEPSDELFREDIERRGAYRQLLKQVQDAQAAVEAHQADLRRLIGARMTAERDAYDALRRAADASAAKAGLPVRGAAEAKAARAAAQEADRLRAEQLRRQLRTQRPPKQGAPAEKHPANAP